jgi:SAM-dependent methyltransferase
MLFDTLKIRFPPSPAFMVADVGAGSGLLTQGLLQVGYRVLAVEPNAEMRRAADSRLGAIDGYSSVEACAESIPVEAGSFGLITVAQAAHWFEVERARAEFLRLLTAKGQVALIWNDRVGEDPLHVALDEVFDCFGAAKRTALLARQDRVETARFFASARPEEFSWPHERDLDEDGLLSLAFSRSYMPGRSTAIGREAAERVREVFRRFAANGLVKVRYRTVAILGRPGQ